MSNAVGNINLIIPRDIIAFCINNPFADNQQTVFVFSIFIFAEFVKSAGGNGLYAFGYLISFKRFARGEFIQYGFIFVKKHTVC